MLPETTGTTSNSLIFTKNDVYQMMSIQSDRLIGRICINVGMMLKCTPLFPFGTFLYSFLLPS